MSNKVCKYVVIEVAKPMHENVARYCSIKKALLNKGIVTFSPPMYYGMEAIAVEGSTVPVLRGLLKSKKFYSELIFKRSSI